jgi:hypothetical protein
MVLIGERTRLCPLRHDDALSLVAADYLRTMSIISLFPNPIINPFLADITSLEGLQRPLRVSDRLRPRTR